MFAGGVASAAPKYPLVSEVQGSVSLTGKDGKKTPLRVKAPLQEQALFETSETGLVKVQLDAERTFSVMPGSAVLLPTISWEGGEAPVIILKSGKLRWQQKSKDKVAYNSVLRSDLYEFIPPAGDYIFEMNPAKAYGEVKVFQGAIEFSALNGDESAQVKSGQQVGFQGLLEGKEIAYDVLLKGKKIPRGNLTPVTDISKKEMALFENAEVKRKQAEANREAHAKAHEEAKKAGNICVKPSGKFNDCSWTCIGNPKSEKKACLVEKAGVSCQRRRCNANGEWSEETTLDAAKASTSCRAQVAVSPCDY
ncbi:MAG: hypothetical protein J7501_11335 [Bdellovibrio sp.]|nr:hypothetical protein [Bdellovibrio sp.]